MPFREEVNRRLPEAPFPFLCDGAFWGNMKNREEIFCWLLGKDFSGVDGVTEVWGLAGVPALSADLTPTQRPSLVVHAHVNAGWQAREQTMPRKIPMGGPFLSPDSCFCISLCSVVYIYNSRAMHSADCCHQGVVKLCFEYSSKLPDVRVWR